MCLTALAHTVGEQTPNVHSSYAGMRGGGLRDPRCLGPVAAGQQTAHPMGQAEEQAAAVGQHGSTLQIKSHPQPVSVNKVVSIHIHTPYVLLWIFCTSRSDLSSCEKPQDYKA